MDRRRRDGIGPPAEASRTQPDSSDGYEQKQRANYLPENGTAVTGSYLAGAEEDQETADAQDNIDRRMADRQLRDELAKTNFSGPGYKLFADQLAAYGLAVIMDWLATGEMFRQCAQRGYLIGRQPENWTQHDIQGLADETVTNALIDFREKGLRGGGWRADGGASMKTYFIIGCINAFPNIYRRWHQEQCRGSTHLLVEPSSAELLSDHSDTDSAERALAKIEAEAIYSNLSAQVKLMVFLSGLGYSHAEIAKWVGNTSTKAVEGALYRARKATYRTHFEERRANPC